MAKEQSIASLAFLVWREHLGDDGLWNPRPADPPLEGGFQVSVSGGREDYLQLADTFRKFAERNTANDSGYHEHVPPLISGDGKVRVHLILRKDDAPRRATDARE